MARTRRPGVIQSLGDLFFTIAPDMGGFQKELVQGIEIAAAGAVANVGAAFENLGVAMIKKFTAPLAVATAANIAQFQALDREIRSTLTLFDTAPSLLDETWDRMSAGITQVSRDIGGLEKDIADGLYQAISAGVPEEDVFAFLDVAQMAAIADKTSDLTTAVDAITTVTNAFKAESLDAATASDILFATVAKGKTTFGELGQSIGRAAGTAANAGVKAAEFGASIATITQSGVQTSEAVSYLRAAITGLLRPSEDMDRIFQRLGFSSAEAAVPIIGLQPAFDAVVSAAGGSTSKLQELIGTAEGVSAILAITGENADAFAKSLSATEDSAGATARAFDIVDAGVGRSFGKLTEAFDRLGNQFGRLGSEIAQPIVDFLADVVNRVSDIFKRFEPVLQGIIDFVLYFVRILDYPAVRQFAAGIASLVIAIGGLLGLLGPVIFSLGKLMLIFVKAVVIKNVTTAVRAFGQAAKAASAGAEKYFDVLSRKLQSVDVASTSLGKAGTKMSEALGSVAVRAGIASAAFIGIAAAIGGAIYLFTQYNNMLEEVRRRNDIFTEGVDRLAESLGITLNAVGQIDFDELNAEVGPKFIVQNEHLIEQITRIIDTLGEAAGRDYVIAIAYEMQSRGATPDEIERTIAAFEDALQTNFAIDIGEIIPQSQLNVLETQLAYIRAEFAEAFPETDDLSSQYVDLGPELEAALGEAADILAGIYQDQGYKDFIAGIGLMEAAVGGFISAEDYLADELLRSFDDLKEGTQGFDVGGAFSTRAPDTLSGALDQLIEKWAKFSVAQANAEGSTNAVNAALERTGRLNFSRGPGDPSRYLPNKAQLETQAELVGGIGDVFVDAEEKIKSAFDEINEGITSSMPLLDVYGGAIEQSFDEWKTGQLQFQEDIVAVAEFREQLKKLPEEVLAAFDSTSLDKQAWLAALNPDEQQEALDLLADSYGAVTDAVDTVWNQDVIGVIEEAQGGIETEYADMYGKALAAGAEVGDNFSIKFNEAAAQWPEIAAFWMGEVANLIGGGTSGGVTLGGPQITAEFNVTNTEVTVNNPTGEPTESSVRNGLAAATTSPALRRGIALP